jgi:SNF2 family DNA or RNA helicase
MILLKDKAAVLFRLKEPSRITTVIPTAKMLNVEGKEFVAVPHRPQETRILRNLGFEVPAPMSMRYTFPAKFKPFEAQIVSAEFASMNDRCFILNSMGLRKCGQVNRALVVCPLSTMERTWADEAFFSFPRYKVHVLHGTREKRLRLLHENADIYLINTDGVKIIKDELRERFDIDLVVIDELALFRNKSTDRWKAMNEICNKQTPRKVWGLTGSPVPNEPTDAWAQVKLVTPENNRLPKYYGAFRNMVMTQVNQFRWEPKPDAVQTVFSMMQPAVRFSIDDCLDLPPQIVTTRKVELTSEQQRAYKSMMNNLVAQLQSGQVTASNDAIKAGKLLQIMLGTVYDEGGNPMNIPNQNRLEVLKETIEESEGKSLVFIPFTGALHTVADYLKKQGLTVEVVDGSVSKTERDRIFGLFQTTADPRVIVANPHAMSHGLTLTAATTIIWYGPTYSNEVYQQACATDHTN